MSDCDEVAVASPDPLDSVQQCVEVAVEVEYDVFDTNKYEPSKPTQEVVVFRVPETLLKVRSAFCNDPMFRCAMQRYIDKQDERPERVMREATSKSLSVPKHIVAGYLSRHDNDEGRVTSGVVNHDVSVVNQNPPETDDVVDETPETVAAVQEAYVDGKMDITEFERALEQVMFE